MNLCFFLLLFSSAALAWPPLFGPEFTFTEPGMERAMREEKTANTRANREALERWRKAAEYACRKNRCRISATADRHGPAYRIVYPDGFWYQVGLDQGVLEVQTRPSSRAEFALRREQLQRDIFALARKMGLNPHETLGGGHLNIGFESTFRGDNLLYRNFFVDQANHPELQLGILGGHPGNSPTIAELSPKGKNSLESLVKEFDQSKMDAFTFSRRVEGEVYVSNPLGWNGNLPHYQNYRLTAVDQALPVEARRVEVRGVRPQRSIDEFLLQLELYEKRLEYLKAYNKPIPLAVPDIAGWSKEEIKSRFLGYLEEMAAPQDKFSSIVNENALAKMPWPRACRGDYSRLLPPQ